MYYNAVIEHFFMFATPWTREQFQWLAVEIRELGGEALVWESRMILPGQDEALVRQFVAEVDAAYQAILTAVFVPAGQPPLPSDAEAFDIPGVRLSHRRGHCSFHTMLREYGLRDPVLQRIARIVDEADVVQEAPVEPAAPGLDLLCRGLRRISPDDTTALRHGLLLYDALYAELATTLDLPPVPIRADIA